MQLHALCVDLEKQLIKKFGPTGELAVPLATAQSSLYIYLISFLSRNMSTFQSFAKGENPRNDNCEQK